MGRGPVCAFRLSALLPMASRVSQRTSPTNGPAPSQKSPAAASVAGKHVIEAVNTDRFAVMPELPVSSSRTLIAKYTYTFLR